MKQNIKSKSNLLETCEIQRQMVVTKWWYGTNPPLKASRYSDLIWFWVSVQAASKNKQTIYSGLTTVMQTLIIYIT